MMDLDYSGLTFPPVASELFFRVQCAVKRETKTKNVVRNLY